MVTKCIHIIILIGLIFFIPLQVFAQGILQGKVRDADTKSPLPGVNVYLQNTLIGSVTDHVGEFRIRNIPTDKYSVIISMMGYEKYTVQDISIEEGKTITLDILLTPTILETQPVIVTATKTERSLRDVPVSVSVLEGREIDRRNIVSLDEAVRYIPGVNINLSQVNIRGSSGYSHGAGSRVLLLVDGVPLLSGDTGEIVWDLVPVDQIEQVEVVKGAGSTLYGSNALGGVINVITKDLIGGSSTRIKFQGGMYDKPLYDEWRWSDRNRFKHTINATHFHSFDKLQIVGSLGTFYDDSYRRNDGRRRTSGYLKTNYLISPQQTLTFTGFFIDVHRQNFLHWGSFHSALEPSEDQIGDRVESFRLQTSLQYRQFVSNGSLLNTRGSWYYTEWKDNLSNEEHEGNDSKAQVVGFETQFHHNLAPSHLLAAGIDLSFQNVTSNIFGDRWGYVFAIYGQDEWTISDQLRFIGGVRFDSTRLDTLAVYENISPRVGFVYVPSPVISVRGSTGTGFRAPSAAEAFTTTAASVLIIDPNPDLKPERSWSSEIGANVSVTEWINVDAAIFWNQYRDLIEPIVVDIDPLSDRITAQFQNIVRARVQGFEGILKLSLFDRIFIPSIGYTFIDGKNLTENKDLKYRHRHLLYTSIFSQYKQFWFEVNYRYLSRVNEYDRELDFVVDNAGEFVPIHVVDVSVGAVLNPAGVPLRITLSGKNILQYYYIEFVGNIAPTRQFLLTTEIAI